MVIMEGYFPDTIRELSKKIDQLHLSYLEMEESSEKFEHRIKLEDAIADFLSEARESQKFRLPQTQEVLYKSAAHKKGFSGYKAVTGWNALQIYAGNLLTQPWRKEYRQIKTYCGFYKHQIEANILGAERMFEAMGYRQVGNGVLVLEGPICPDEVANVSRDCLVAYVECQILKHIWEEVSIVNLSWLDILMLRNNYPGSPEFCIRNIKYRLNKNDVVQETQMFHPTSPTGQAPIASNYNYNTAPAHNRHPPGIQVPLCCSTAFVPYGIVPCTAHMPIMKQPITPNGYYYGNTLPMMSPVYSVPTGQLIELDSRNDYDIVDGPAPCRTRRSRTNSSVALESETVKSGETLKNGFGAVQSENHNSEGDWDYVYRDLEKQGYTKDLGERGNVLGYQASTNEKARKFKEPKESKKIKMTNLDEAFSNLQVTDRPLKITEALEKIEQKPVERIIQTKERRHSQGSFYENVPSGDLPKPSISKLVHTKILPKEKQEKSIQALPNAVQNNLTKEKGSAVLNGVPKWDCKSCTYLNDLSSEICEICSKSKNCPQETPIEIGGAHCITCTLVNPKTAKKCQACGQDLKDSPTYI